jgi:hypothetical protein
MADETNNKNAVFKFYLNRQGVKGNKGEKGDQGFSPIIEVSENTAASYKLQITTETDQIETPNLRGNAVEDLGGTYMRFNTENQTMYAGTADVATTSSQGEVTLASDEAIANLSDTNVLTPDGLVNNATSLFQSTDGSIAINQDENTGKINLATHNQASQTDVDALTLRVGTCEDNITDNAGRIQTLEHNLAVDEQAIQNNTSAIGNKVDKVAGKGLSTNDFANEDKDKLTHAVVDTDLANVAFTGSFTDLINTPASYSSGLGIDISNTNQISVKVDGTTVAYNLNGELTSSGGGAVDSVNGQTGVVVLTASDVGALADTTKIPSKTSDLTNDSGFITGITSSDVTTALGYTPQTLLVSGTNIKTINNESILGSGNINIQSGGTVDQTYDATSANAQSGVAIAGAGFLNNTATNPTSLAIKATTAPTTYTSTILNGQSVTGNGGTAIGYGTRAVSTSTALGTNSYGQGRGSTAIGSNATSTGLRSLAIGGYNDDTMGKAHADGQDAIQIGIGQNNTASSLAVGFNGTNYQLLDGTTGLIPAARIPVDGSTITVNASGQLVSSGGGGGTPTNMMTTDTDQYVTGTKTSLLKDIRYFDSVDGNGTFNAMWLGKSAGGYMGLTFDSSIGNSNYYLLNQGYTSTLNVEGFQNFKINGDTENRRCYITNANLSKGSTPSSTEYIGLLFDDSTGREGEMSDWVQHRFGNVEVNVDTSGTTTLAIDAYRNYGYYPEGMESTGLKLIIDSSGNKTATIDTGTFSRTDGTNTYKILDESDNTKFDGQFTNAYLELANSVVFDAKESKSYSLSAYLPNDNYNYKIILSGTVASSSTSGQTLDFRITTDLITNPFWLARLRPITSSSLFGSYTFEVPVGTNRTINIVNGGSPSTLDSLRVYGYRRIGTNQ